MNVIAFLPNILLQPKIAEHDACNLEHVISEESFQKLKDVLENQGGGDNMGN